jgi:ATP-dependent exoDNAse (exonuclease V) alpha subunit
MNSEQTRAFQLFENGKSMLISGPGGVGKSFLIKHFRKYCREKFKHFAVTSTTGISSLLISGVTIHSYLGLGIGEKSTEELKKSIKRNKTLLERYINLDVLIIDEVSMLSSELLEKIDDLLKYFKENETSFGGVQVILLGDFYQLPVVDKSEHFIFESARWTRWDFEMVILKEIMRQKDEQWITILNHIREGKIVNDDMRILKERLSVKFEEGIIPTILYSTNNQVDNENLKQLELLKKKHSSHTYDGVYNFKGKSYVPTEILKSSFPYYLEKIELTKESQVMFLINNLEEGIANGSRGVVVEFTLEGHPIVKMIDGRQIVVKPHTWELEVDKNIYTLTQYPLKLAWAITIHKSQGLTLDCVQTNLGSKIFEYGQVYVALSRVKSLEGLYLLDFIPSKIKANPIVKLFYMGT